MNDSHDNAADDLAMLERFADQQELLDCGCPRQHLEDASACAVLQVRLRGALASASSWMPLL